MPTSASAVIAHGALGLGEAYMDGWWDSPALDQMIHRVLRADLPSRIRPDGAVLASMLRGALLNPQRRHAFEVAERHYDLGNDLYAAMLDPLMVYSCGYWKDAHDLASAQVAKLDLVCRKMGLTPGMRVLDIGSGWGGFLRHAARHYGIAGTGVTVSREQAAFADAHREGLPIETFLMDYQDLEGRFDRIVSIGMFEHVGHKNYRAYLEKARSLLAEDGLMLLHTIGGNLTTTHGDPWLEKYIFPNGMLPSQRQIGQAAEGLFVVEDWHNFGADYDPTLMAWHDNFERAWPQLEGRYGARFRRMWRYYLLSLAAVFRARRAQLWQVVLSPEGVPGGYISVR
ncbi:cyclopropane fatty acyl phospholipid synthase [Arsenicitalea aurantiaca]|uniref:cyclopropane fatty acyl phospholipid synthase n=1 Tax=Arsenicitalea aurantiaca TaxID=1783274 RepID=UPI0019572185|nr:cyclopropane fatty acyl phospholipid synthase [Arsenicitalea aurantiaca]